MGDQQSSLLLDGRKLNHLDIDEILQQDRGHSLRLGPNDHILPPNSVLYIINRAHVCVCVYLLTGREGALFVALEGGEGVVDMTVGGLVGTHRQNQITELRVGRCT